MKDLIEFDFKGTDVRVVMRDGEPWWVAKDVCDVLGLTNITEALRGMDDDELTSTVMKSGGQGRRMQIVNEPGLYSLILKSRRPEAKTFKRWLTHDVIPSIRKTGGYVVTRAKSKEYRKYFTDTLKAVGYDKPRQYQHTTIEMKRELGFPWVPKDDLSEGELRLVMAAELIATEKIRREQLDGFDRVHPACVSSSHGVAALIEAQ